MRDCRCEGARGQCFGGRDCTRPLKRTSTRSFFSCLAWHDQARLGLERFSTAIRSLCTSTNPTAECPECLWLPGWMKWNVFVIQSTSLLADFPAKTATMWQAVYLSSASNTDPGPVQQLHTTSVLAAAAASSMGFRLPVWLVPTIEDRTYAWSGNRSIRWAE
jgi:hypothetical protein